MNTSGFQVSAAEWGTLTGEPHVVGRVGALEATSGDIAALDAKVRHLIASTDAPGEFAKLDPSLVADWIGFRAEWAQFFADNSGGAFAIPLIVLQGVQDKFAIFVSRYNELLVRIKAAGVKTDATPSGSSGGNRSWLEVAADAVGLSRAAAPWVAGGVALVTIVTAAELYRATRRTSR